MTAQPLEGFRVLDLRRLFADPHVQARGAVIDINHPQLGAIASLASQIRLSETPVRYDRRPALLGEHTRETLGELLGLDAARLDALAAKGTIQ